MTFDHSQIAGNAISEVLAFGPLVAAPSARHMAGPIFFAGYATDFEKIIDTPQLHRNFQNNLINLILYRRASVPSRIDNG